MSTSMLCQRLDRDSYGMSECTTIKSDQIKSHQMRSNHGVRTDALIKKEDCDHYISGLVSTLQTVLPLSHK